MSLWSAMLLSNLQLGRPWLTHFVQDLRRRVPQMLLPFLTFRQQFALGNIPFSSMIYHDLRVLNRVMFHSGKSSEGTVSVMFFVFSSHYWASNLNIFRAMGNPANQNTLWCHQTWRKIIQLDPTSSSNVHQLVTVWLLNIAMEHGPFIDDLPIKNGGSFHSYVKYPEGNLHL